MMKRQLALALFLTPVTLVGCGADATVAPKGDGGIAGDSGPGNDGGANNDSGTTPTKGGGVYLASYASTPVAGMSASAGFYIQ